MNNSKMTYEWVGAAGGARARGTAAVRWIHGQHTTGDERLEAGTMVLDRPLPVPGRAASTSVLELVRRHPRTCTDVIVLRYDTI